MYVLYTPHTRMISMYFKSRQFLIFFFPLLLLLTHTFNTETKKTKKINWHENEIKTKTEKKVEKIKNKMNLTLKISLWKPFSFA